MSAAPAPGTQPVTTRLHRMDRPIRDLGADRRCPDRAHCARDWGPKDLPQRDFRHSPVIGRTPRVIVTANGTGAQSGPLKTQVVPKASPADAVRGLMMRDQLLRFGVLLTCFAAAVLMVTSGVGPAAAQSAPASVQLSGIYQLIVADPAPVLGAPLAPAEQGFLIVGTRAYRLHLPSTARPRPGAHITVSGTLTGPDFTASAVSAGVTVQAAPAVTGTTKVLVILASWTAPDSVTQDSAGRQMFTDSSTWYSQASYGALTQTGAVTPWVSIAAPVGNKCYGDMHNEMVNAKSAALALGYNSANYDRTVLYFPHDSAANSDCSGYAGWAAVSGNEVWLNGYIDRRVTVHEQGHNYGLLHANTLACKDSASGNGIALAPAANCVSTEYGDDYDAMGGSGLVGSFSADEKNQLSWLGGHKAALAPGGTVTIAPIETAAAVNAAASAAPRTARALLIGDVWQKREVARALDRGRQLALVKGGRSADAAREDLGALGDEPREGLHVLEVDVADLLDRELADALAAHEELLLDGFANGSSHCVSPDPSRVTRGGSRRPVRPGAWWRKPRTDRHTALRTPRGAGGAASCCAPPSGRA